MPFKSASVPMTNLQDTNETDGTEGEKLRLIGLNDGVAQAFAEVPAGKALLVSDEDSYRHFAAFAENPRVLFIILDSSDCLPLFSMPDGITEVLAAGGGKVLRAARFYATVNRIACYLFPTDGTLEGAYGAGDVSVGGEATRFPLSEANVFCDVSLIRSFACAYARLLLSKLALVEAQAMRAFQKKPENDLIELVGLECAKLEDLSQTEILRKNARLRNFEAEGFPAGEGALLAEDLGGDCPQWEAFLLLLACYGAFFQTGKPRKYFVPDYRERARRANVDYSRIFIPTEEEYAQRAIALERMRGPMLGELREIEENLAIYRRVMRVYGVQTIHSEPERLNYLPERYPKGLCAVIRDFGLMEWK